MPRPLFPILLSSLFFAFANDLFVHPVYDELGRAPWTVLPEHVSDPAALPGFVDHAGTPFTAVAAAVRQSWTGAIVAFALPSSLASESFEAWALLSACYDNATDVAPYDYSTHPACPEGAPVVAVHVVLRAVWEKPDDAGQVVCGSCWVADVWTTVRGEAPTVGWERAEGAERSGVVLQDAFSDDNWAAEDLAFALQQGAHPTSLAFPVALRLDMEDVWSVAGEYINSTSVTAAVWIATHSTFNNTPYNASNTTSTAQSPSWWSASLPPIGSSGFATAKAEWQYSPPPLLELGFEHTCFLDTLSGGLRCWGSGDSGRLGYGDTEDIGDDELPASIGGVDVGGAVVAFALGDYHTCTLLATRRVRCWGYGDSGRLGYGNEDTIGDDEPPSSAGDVDVGGEVVSITAGASFTCALLTTRRVRCWGANEVGQLGYSSLANVGDDEDPSSAGDLEVGGDVVALASGDFHSCALLSTRRVRCWGSGGSGRLGYGNEDSVGANQSPAAAGDVDVGGDVVAVAAGALHTCALLATRRVRCWGWAQFGQLGYGNNNNVGDDELPSSAGDVNVGGDVVAISTSGSCTCALLSTRRVRCWGDGTGGALGYGSLENVGDDEEPADMGDVDLGGDVIAVAVGGFHTCAVLATRRVRCWGDASSGQLGYGSIDSIGDDEFPSSVPAFDPRGGSRFRTLQQTLHASVLVLEADSASVLLATGGHHTCVVRTRTDSLMRCWGFGGYGGLGYGNMEDVGDDEYPSSKGYVRVMSEVSDRTLILAIAAGEYHTCALLSTHRVRCWGNADEGQLGYGNVDNVGDDEVPADAGDVVVAREADTAVVAIAAGEAHTCALLSTRRVRCWGSADEGQLGYGNVDNVGDDEMPADAGDVDVGGDVVAISAGETHTCALLSTRAVRCWGSGADGRLGYGNLDNVGDDEVPADVGDVDVGGEVVAISAGGAHTCALLSNRALRCWGWAQSGQLGYGSSDSVGDDEVPAAAGDVDVGEAVVHVSAGGTHTCALLASRRVVCWGWGASGQLGYSSTDSIGNDQLPSSMGPVDVGGDVVYISASTYHTCAVMSSNAVRCWGSGDSGRLGYRNTRNIGDNEAPSKAGDVRDRRGERESTAFLGDSVVGVVAPASHTWGEPLQPLSAPTWLAPVPPSLRSIDLIPQPEQTFPANCLTESGVQQHPESGRVLCMADVPARGLAAAAGVVDAYIPPQPPLVSPTTGGTVVVLGDFSVLALLGNPSVSVGGVPASDVRLREGFSQLQFTAPAGVGADLPVAVRLPLALPPAILSRLSLLPTLSYPLPTIDSVVPASGLAVLGGSSIVLVGSAFGPSAVHGANPGEAVAASGGSLQITVGGRPCLESRTILDTQIQCITPPLVGTDLLVEVVVGGQDATAAQMVSTSKPAVEAVTPPYLLGGGDALQDVVVNGTNLGLASDDFDMDDTLVGGVPCGWVEVLEPGTAFLCGGLDSSSGWGASASSVQVSVAGQSSGPVVGVFMGVPPVGIVVASSLGALRTTGGTVVRLVADGLGRSPDDVGSVHVQDSAGQEFLLPLTAWSETQVEFEMPPGVGVASVQIESAVGVLSNAVLLPYDPPTLLSVSPSHILAGAHGVDVVIRGRNLPPSALADAALEPPLFNVSLGGRACESAVVVDAATARCEGFAADEPWADSAAATVCVGGVCSERIIGLFRGISRPSLSGTSPEAVDAATGTLTLLGANFGLAQADLGAIFIGSEECASPVWISESSATCTVPPTHADLADTANHDDAYQPPDLLDVVLCNAAGECSDALSVPVAGRGAVPVPVAAPSALGAYREVGQFDSVIVSWSFPTPDEELVLLAQLALRPSNASAHAAATSFVVQLSQDPASFANAVARTVARASDAAAGTTATVVTTVAVSRHSPYFARVAAVTAEGGVGNWSATFGPIHETCLATEYLALHHSSLEDQVCAACPESIAVCGGLTSWNVTARSGFWRISWATQESDAQSVQQSTRQQDTRQQATSPILFARCLTPEACRGWSGAPPRADPSRNASLASRRVAVPWLSSLRPEEWEACAEGQTGVLCDACADGYFKGIGGRCAPCRSAGASVARVVGFALVGMVVLSVLLVRSVDGITAASLSHSRRASIAAPPGSVAAETSLPAGKFVVTTLKILMNHLQTVSIVAGARVDWPATVVDFFSVVKSGSSLTAQGVGIECLLGPSGRSPFVLLSISIYVLLPCALVYAVLFWTLFDPAKRALQQLAAFLRGETTAQEQPLIVADASSSTSPATSTPTTSTPAAATLALSSTASSLVALRRRMLTTVGVLCVFFYSTITSSAFRLLTCRTVAPEAVADAQDAPPSSLAQSRMAANLEYSCDEAATRRLAAAVAFPPLVLFTVALPLVLAGALHRGLEEGGDAWRVWSFATAGHRSRATWWESWVMARKALLAAVAVLLSTATPQEQLASCMAVTMLAALAHAWMQPYAVDALNNLEMGAQVAAAMTVLVGLYVLADNRSMSASGATAAVILGNVVVVAMALLLVVLALRDLARGTAGSFRQRRRSAITVAPTPKTPSAQRLSILTTISAPSDDPEDAGAYADTLGRSADAANASFSGVSPIRATKRSAVVPAAAPAGQPALAPSPTPPPPPPRDAKTASSDSHDPSNSAETPARQAWH